MENIACALCGNKDSAHFLSTKNNFNLVKCNGCGLVFMNPRPPKEEQIDYYEGQDLSYVEEKKDIISQKSFKKINAWINNSILELFYGYSHLAKSSFMIKIIKYIFITPFFIRNVITGKDIYSIAFKGEGKMLDIGCGKGRNVPKYKNIGWKISGIEPSKAVAFKTSHDMGIEVICGDFETIDLSKKSFDAVLMIDVLEHLHNPLESLKKVSSLLKTNGVAIVRLPNIDSLEFRLLKNDWRFIDAPNHLYHFSPQTLKKLLKESGFKIRKFKFDFRDISGLNRYFYKIGFNEKFINSNKFVRKILKVLNFFIGVFGQGSIMVVHAVKI